jgi:hypothetical protein
MPKIKLVMADCAERKERNKISLTSFKRPRKKGRNKRSI